MLRVRGVERCGCVRSVTVLPAHAHPRSRVVAQASKDKKALDGSGYIKNDNSGRGNIFPTSSKAYYSSPTASAVAKEGLGGFQGGAVLAAAIAVVGLATVGVLGQGTGETLQVVAGNYAGDGLTSIADRIAASL
eukprot:CAMPEP_0202898770 /NCGR_PEP_ID=MMETSP1392-20130828/7200_1 /ASSEMBLY_ACC=CAM_ASM_000868 /TAXON_ID=225041 /ORGANISM="Chlamydomonas chlamydogama, Strain SAG 11-48b" /LENGTH=133 /DNA_ID=CAMNT_0049584789 /DNA_START=82 /DNA_END=483 /DNA_ORIENTATION=+